MTSGCAHGVDRKYQEQARDFLVRMSTALEPYSGDGIDVRIPLGSAPRTFDVALKDPAGRIVVAECRRRRSKVKLADLDAFAHRVRLLGEETGLPVEGVYFAKTAYQLGAVKAGGDAKIQVAVCAQDQPARALALAFEHYDPERNRRTRDGRVMLNAGLTIRRELGIVVARGDGPDPPRQVPDVGSNRVDGRRGMAVIDDRRAKLIAGQARQMKMDTDAAIELLHRCPHEDALQNPQGSNAATKKIVFGLRRQPLIESRKERLFLEGL